MISKGLSLHDHYVGLIGLDERDFFRQVMKAYAGLAWRYSA
jgi:hypothetical protein